MRNNTQKICIQARLLIVLLIFTGCKSDTAVTDKIDSTVFEMWIDFTKYNPEFKDQELPESWYFHNNKEDANRLAELTLTGKKRAGSSLYKLYEIYKADLPKAGTKHIITDFNGKAKAIIEIKSVEKIPFNKISKMYAELDMGTNLEPLKKWPKAHWDFFKNMLKETDILPTEDMLVVCEKFEIIWPIQL